MTVFISWSGALSQKMALALKKWIPTVIHNAKIFVSSEDIERGGLWTADLMKALLKADYGIICIVPGNVDEPWLVFEAGVLAKTLTDTDTRICPFILGLTPGEVTGPLGQFQFTEYNKHDIRSLVHRLNDLNLKVPKDELEITFNSRWPALKKSLDPLQKHASPIAEGKVKRPKGRNQTSKDLPSGVVNPAILLDSKERLTDEVFAIELLTQPIKLKRDESGHVTVTINRHGVQEMLYSNAGKVVKAQQYVRHKDRKELMRLDREIQRFLADGDRPGEFTINLPKLPRRLRWASGGILSIVTYGGQQWVPLFFRDIRPYGWNIALGTTERWFDKTTGVLEDNYKLAEDLNYPHTFIMREFLEETLIVSGAPQRGGTLYYKSFDFPGPQSPFAATRAKEFYEEHCRLRAAKQEDRLMIRERGKVKARLLKTTCSLTVRSKKKDYHTHGVLICFSLLDLGIEVVEVAKYHLKKRDWILDGEIREKHDATELTTEKELIRMPTALLSLEYLRDIFGRGKDWHRYTFGPQPSITASRPPDPKTEIEHFMFDWDVRRRMQAVEGEWDAKTMKSRYLDWYDKFGQHFITQPQKAEDKWDVSYAEPSRLFVPGTAKILNLYFSTIDGKEKK